MRGDVCRPTRGAVVGCTLVLVTAMAFTGRAQGVRYVDGSATGSADGASWANAYTNLAMALAATGGGTNLWVAQGTYWDWSPFQLKSGVGLYGGFTNGMSALTERDWVAYPTRLDGQGARTVVFGANNARLDGFVITNGAAVSGGGMYNNAVAPTLANCTFVNNIAGGGGGAMYNFGDAADVVISNCLFLANTAATGGAIHTYLGDPIVRDSQFVANRATGAGGAFYNQDFVLLTIVGSTFASNRAATVGGVIYNSPSGNGLDINTSVFVANRSDQNAGVAYCYNTVLLLRGNRFLGNVANTAGVLWNDQSSRGLVEDCVFVGNQATNGVGGVYYGNTGNGMLTNRLCVFAGNSASNQTPGEFAGGGGVASGLGDNSVYESCVFSGNRAAGSGGVFGKAHYDGDPAWHLRRSRFAGNESGLSGGVFYGVSGSGPRLENCVLGGNVAVNGGAVALRSETSSGFRAVHCTFRGNRATTSGGALLSGSAFAHVTNSIVWGNSAGGAGNQIHQLTANRAVVGYSVVDGGWASPGSNNLALDPAFGADVAGTWVSVSDYDGLAGQTALTDGSATWSVNSHAGLTVNPDTNQWLQFVVASNTVDTLYVWGNARVNRTGAPVADPGDGFTLHTVRTLTTSPVVDAGLELGVTNDLAGDVRPREAGPDLGVYEVQEDVYSPPYVSNVVAAPLHLRIELSWSNPPTHDLTGVLIVRREGAAPTGIPEPGTLYAPDDLLGDGDVVHTALASSWSDPGLTAGTDYHYRLFAYDDVANYAPGVGAHAIPVNDTTPPAVVSDLSAVGVTGAVHLAWTNPVDADFGGVLIVRRQGGAPTGVPSTGVVYTPGQAFGDGTVVSYSPANTFADTGLPDDTAYHYAIFAYDHSRNYASAAVTDATTAVDVVPPADVTRLTLVSDDSWIELAWTNPPDADAAGVLVLRRTGSAPSGVPATATEYAVGEEIGDGQVVFAGLASAWRDNGVTNGVEYHYAVHARDEVPNYSAGTGGSATPMVRNVLYVDGQATGGANNGTSWGDAFTSLTTALAAAGSGTNLWVASGTYKPGVIRDATFLLKAGVGLLGGFSNGMTTVNQRDWNAHVTTLSGDLNGNLMPDVADVFHVVTATWATNAVLDGVTVTCGYAYNPISDTDAFRNGGGLYLWMSDVTLTVRNTRFLNNAANYLGGAACIRHVNRGSTGVVFSNCVFRGNSTFRLNDNQGGALYHVFRPLTVEDSVFEDNTGHFGGAIRAYGDDPILRRNTFARNTAGGSGAAIYHDRIDLTGVMPSEMTDCRFYANRTAQFGAVDYRRAGYTNDVIHGCDFYANETTTGAGAGLFLLGYNSVVDGCRFSGNTVNGGNVHAGAVYLYDSDANMRNVVLAGNTAPGYGGGLWADNASRPRFENLLVAGNQARYNGGGICLYDVARSTNVFVNCTIVGNRTTEVNAGYGGGGLYLRTGVFTLTNSIVYGNRTAGSGPQVRVDLSGDVLHVGHSDIEGGVTNVFAVAGVGKFESGGVIAANPLFMTSTAGVWTASAVYTNASGLTVLTDASASWTPGKLAGLVLNPNTNASMLAYLVVTNTTTTLSVMGVATTGQAGAAYRLDDYRLRNVSPGIDTGGPQGAPTRDLPGLARPQGVGVDMGAYERVREPFGPDPVTGLTATGGMDQVALAWVNPTNTDFTGVLIVRRQGAAPTGVPVTTNEYAVGDVLGDGVVVYAGSGANGSPGQSSSWLNVGVPALQTFHYAVFAYDGVPNYAAGAGTQATTLTDTVAPGPVSGVATVDSGAWLTLTWTNPPDADYAEVLIVRREGAAPTGLPVWTNRYAAGTNLGDGVVVYQGPGSSALPGSGSSWTDTNTAASVGYHYVLFAADEVPNYATGVGLAASTRLPGVLFVNVSATGQQNGRTWTDAFSSLHTALAQSTSNDALWVAQGIYTPGTFNLRTNGAVYGGFVVGMSALGERNPAAYPTVLSSGGPVVRGAPGSRLDGFTVTGGSGVNGGGYSMSAGTVTVANCVFSNNQATLGGGLYFSGVQATIERCRIVNNIASGGGGGVYAERVYVTPAGTIRNCVFSGNRCEAPGVKCDGGGLALVACPYRVESCTFEGNVTGRRGGAIKIYWGNGLEPHVIKNCILWNNRLTDPPTASSEGGWEIAVQEDLGYNPITLDMRYTDWSPDTSGDRFYNYFEEAPTILNLTELMEVDPAFADAAGGDLHLKATGGRWSAGTWVSDSTNSPCIDAGDPLSAFELETEPNGDRINMGAYGNTPEASRSGPGRPASGFLMLVR